MSVEHAHKAERGNASRGPAPAPEPESAPILAPTSLIGPAPAGDAPVTRGQSSLQRLPSEALRQQMVRSLGRRSGNHVVQRVVSPPPRVPIAARPKRQLIAAGGGNVKPANKVAFVREEGLNLRAAPGQNAPSLAKMKFGQRVHTLEDANPTPSWQKAALMGQAGYVFAPHIHFPPEALIQKDPALSMIRVRSGQTFWGLVKEQYGIQGNESTADLNVNHYINAIRVVNKPEAFNIRTDLLDDIGNFVIAGRDASDTFLIAGVDLWIPSYGVATKMDVGSGTVTGEITRAIKKIEQKIQDFKDACRLSVQYMPGAIANRAGDTAMGLLNGLVEFAIDAAKILAISTAVGAILGGLFGFGAGALPGAEIGFEVGLLILEVYGLATLIEAVLQIAGSLLSQLGHFVSLVWSANGDKKQLDLAARTLADALGILVSAVLIALAAYLMKKGMEAIKGTKFAKTVGETKLAEWLKDRQKMTTTRATIKERFKRAGGEREPQGQSGSKPASYVNNNPKATADEVRLGELLDQKAQAGELGDVKRVEGAAEVKGQRSGDYRLQRSDGSQVAADLYQPESGNPRSIASNIIEKSGQAETVVVELGRGRSGGITTEQATSMAKSVVQTPGHGVRRVIVIKDGKIIASLP